MRAEFALLVAMLAGCHTGKSPELRVLGVHDAVAHEVVFVQVSNPAKQAMRLTKLTYTFAASGGTVATGEMPLQRDVPAGSAVVVEVPLDARSKQPMTLHGVLTAELDHIERTFPVEAHVKPGQSDAAEIPSDETSAQPANPDTSDATDDEPKPQPMSPDSSEATSDEAHSQPGQADIPGTASENNN